MFKCSKRKIFSNISNIDFNFHFARIEWKQARFNVWQSFLWSHKQYSHNLSFCLSISQYCRTSLLSVFHLRDTFHIYISIKASRENLWAFKLKLFLTPFKSNKSCERVIHSILNYNPRIWRWHWNFIKKEIVCWRIFIFPAKKTIYIYTKEVLRCAR